MSTIDFAERQFEVREIFLPQFGNILLSTSSLNEILMNKNGGYVSEEAKRVDEQIFYYIDDSEMKLEDEKLIHLVSKQIL
jgi:uncharacterized protein (DUF1499 family)